jgi:tRNA-splicing ligase RtcB
MPIDTLQTRHVPISLWTRAHEVEPQALDQLRNIAALPWAYHHIAVMPDVHLGKGATVGSVIAMRDAVSPAAVGVDIGCGMTAVRTNLRADDLPDDLSRIRSDVEAAIPVSFTMHDQPAAGVADADLWSEFDALAARVRGRLDKAMRQVGTLGGGNHFIELCLDASDRVWLMLHSGSRNVGKELAEHHISVARALPHNADLPDRDLAVFVSGTPQMAAYRHDLFWAQRYAMANRVTMLRLCQDVVRRHFGQVEFGRADLLPPQLPGRGAPLRRRRARHPQGRDPRGRRRAGHHPRLDGHPVVHRPRQGQHPSRSSRRRTVRAAG